MLEDAGEEAPGLDLQRFAGLIEALQDKARGTGDGAVDAGDAQATLVEIDGFLGKLGEFRIEYRVEFIFHLGHKHTAVNADLIGGEADAVGFLHGTAHRFDEFPDIFFGVVREIERLRFGAQEFFVFFLGDSYDIHKIRPFYLFSWFCAFLSASA